MSGNSKLNRVSVGALGDCKFALRCACHSLLIDGAHDNPGAIGLSQLQHLEETLVTIFVVGGVEDAFTTGHLEPGLHLLPLGGIKHQRQVDVGDETAHQLMHVPFTIATDVIDVDVEHVGVLLNLTPRHSHQAIPILLS